MCPPGRGGSRGAHLLILRVQEQGLEDGRAAGGAAWLLPAACWPLGRPGVELRARGGKFGGCRALHGWEWLGNEALRAAPRGITRPACQVAPGSNALFVASFFQIVREIARKPASPENGPCHSSTSIHSQVKATREHRSERLAPVRPGPRMRAARDPPRPSRRAGTWPRQAGRRSVSSTHWIPRRCAAARSTCRERMPGPREVSRSLRARAGVIHKYVCTLSLVCLRTQAVRSMQFQ